MAALVTGDKELDRALSIIQNGFVAKAMKPALAAGLKRSVKFMKSAVPDVEKDAKKVIGWRLNKSKRTGEAMGKAGAAVGMRAKRIKQAADRAFIGRVGRRGVGIGARNVMWWILGTAQRFTGSKRIRSRAASRAGISRMPTGGKIHPTGRMPAQMDPVKDGFERGRGAILQDIQTAAASSLAQLVK